MRQVIGVPGVEFQSENFNWLVAANVGDVVTCVATERSGVKTLDDAIKRKEPLVVAASGPGSSTLTWPRAYNEILGANFKIVSGYPGAAGLRAAIERGEADATCIAWASYMRRARSEMEASGLRNRFWRLWIRNRFTYLSVFGFYLLLVGGAFRLWVGNSHSLSIWSLLISGAIILLITWFFISHTGLNTFLHRWDSEEKSIKKELDKHGYTLHVIRRRHRQLETMTAL